jgi:ribosomal protein S27E
MCKTRENKIFLCHCGSKNFVQQKNGPILAVNQNQDFENKKVIECLICGLTFVQKLEGRFSAVECNICGSIFFFPKLNGNVSAVPEKISAVPEKVSAVPEKISAVPEKISAVHEKVSAVLEKISAVPQKKDSNLMKNLSCWNCGSTSTRVFDIKKTFECKHCHSTLFFSRKNL